jgi:hypothetical protein
MLPEQDSTGKSINQLNTAELIILQCEELKNLLLDKNAAYGDAVHQRGPLFNVDPVVGIQARINDKLRRLRNKGITDDTEDAIQDLMGYLIHLKIALLRKKNPQ